MELKSICDRSKNMPNREQRHVKVDFLQERQRNKEKESHSTEVLNFRGRCVVTKVKTQTHTHKL